MAPTVLAQPCRRLGGGLIDVFTLQNGGKQRPSVYMVGSSIPMCPRIQPAVNIIKPTSQYVSLASTGEQNPIQRKTPWHPPAHYPHRRTNNFGSSNSSSSTAALPGPPSGDDRAQGNSSTNGSSGVKHNLEAFIMLYIPIRIAAFVDTPLLELFPWHWCIPQAAALAALVVAETPPAPAPVPAVRKRLRNAHSRDCDQRRAHRGGIAGWVWLWVRGGWGA